MEISRKLELIEPPLSQEQRDILAYDDGPLLIIAGPGSGKTYSLIFRAMNILLHQKAKPSELILCTYTDKAANEMRSRFMKLAQDVGYQEDLSQLRVGTIHSICNQLITEYRHLTPLGNDYTVLDDFAQSFFIFRHLDIIDQTCHFRNKWQQPQWTIAKRLQKYFDKITEELIKQKRLVENTHPFLHHLGLAYSRYKELLIEYNCVSYAAQLKIAHNLLHNSDVADIIIQKFRYVFVDEYQDTNYIQERIIRKLASATNNLCVVGDEDQGLYRFRGATVRNILEFKQKDPNCLELRLTTNYRSHKDIIRRYDMWMKSCDWTDSITKEQRYRRDKTIKAYKEKAYSAHPATIYIKEQTLDIEAEQFAELIFFLKQQKVISDYNQVALLLYSVKQEYSKAYIKALTAKGINAFCPRARSYFTHQEVHLLIACFVRILNYNGELANDLLEKQTFTEYIQKDCLELLNNSYGFDHPLHLLLEDFKHEIVQSEEQNTGVHLADCFYRLLAVEPFTTFMQDEQNMHNLVLFSKELQVFQAFFKETYITQETQHRVCYDFFCIFLRLLEYGGINEYEDIEQPFPEDHVQIMTIHQAKGLEFPIVVVGSLGHNHSGTQEVDRELGHVYDRGLFEKEARIPGFDMMRLYYVAFSRAEHLLVLTGNQRTPPHEKFAPMLDELPRWPAIQDKILSLPQAQVKKPAFMKQHYSFTGNIQVYETCTRKYQYFREFGFVPARQKEVFLGLLVHNTLEEVHREAKKGMIASLNKDKVQIVIDKVCKNLLHKHSVPEDIHITKENAYMQVWNYVRQNLTEMQHILEIEVDVTIEKDDYILTGRIDVLRERNGILELLDFKTDYRPEPEAVKLTDYERQLCIYASALEKRYHKRPERLNIYWTKEQRREDAIMTFSYSSAMVERVGHSIDGVAADIKAKKFEVTTKPEQGVCRTCDMQHTCINDKTIEPFTV